MIKLIFKYFELLKKLLIKDDSSKNSYGEKEKKRIMPNIILIGYAF